MKNKQQKCVGLNFEMRTSANMFNKRKGYEGHEKENFVSFVNLFDCDVTIRLWNGAPIRNCQTDGIVNVDMTNVEKLQRHLDELKDKCQDWFQGIVSANRSNLAIVHSQKCSAKSIVQNL